MAWQGVLAEYRDLLPLAPGEPVVTLNEGNTPLVEAAFKDPHLDGRRLLLKVEGCNPTGSFKDRGMALAVTKALAAGARAVICASTGNTSAAAAAYAGRAGLACFVVLPEGYVATGKLAQALIHGAKVMPIKGNFDRGLALVRKLVEADPRLTLVNSLNPHRIPGQRTAAFEICDALGDAPDLLAIPVGNGGNVTAYWQGFEAYRQAGFTSRSPVMLGFQAAGAAPLVHDRPVDRPETVATAIRIGRPVNWELAQDAARASGGAFTAVTDEELLQSLQDLAVQVGLFVEPASAASVAGVRKLAREGRLPPGATVVCVLTGNGLKDPEVAHRLVDLPPAVAPEFAALAEHIEAQLSDG